MSSILIQTRELTKTFGSKHVPMQALKGISLNINDRDFVCITGKSGCGKSTLLSILGLLDTATSGEYILCGKNLATLSSYQKAILRNQHIGWIFQNFNLINDMTVLQNIILPLRYNPNVPKSQYRNRAEAVLKDVGIVDKIDNYPAQLSGGEQQRVSIARALITQPSILLADEPTGNLDSINEQIIFDLLTDLNCRGVTILLVTHSTKLADKCGRIIRIEDGLIKHS